MSEKRARGSGFYVGRRRCRTLKSWESMIVRCENNTHKKWALYGGRGISVCDRWKDFSNFLADMGERPSGKSLDRINNDGNYEPGNCRWATAQQQAENSRAAKWIEAAGKRMTISGWARFLGISQSSMSERISKFGVDAAVSMPRRYRIKPAIGELPKP